MKRAALIVLSLVVAANVFAADLEKVLLPIAPSVVYCGYHSKYDTRMVVFNAATQAIDGIEANTGAVVEGEVVPVPVPRFAYVPRDFKLTLVVESSEVSRPDERSYTELPVVREADFREGKIQIVGVRMDSDFRKTLRLYGLNGTQPTEVRVRVFDLTSSTPAYEHEYWLTPQAGVDANGLDLAPTFNMECDLSDYVSNYAHPVRVEIESLTPGAKVWGFVSVTNNVTQHFYTVVP